MCPFEKTKVQGRTCLTQGASLLRWPCGPSGCPDFAPLLFRRHRFSQVVVHNLELGYQNFRPFYQHVDPLNLRAWDGNHFSGTDDKYWAVSSISHHTTFLFFFEINIASDFASKVLLFNLYPQHVLPYLFSYNSLKSLLHPTWASERAIPRPALEARMGSKPTGPTAVGSLDCF